MKSSANNLNYREHLTEDYIQNIIKNNFPPLTTAISPQKISEDNNGGIGGNVNGGERGGLKVYEGLIRHALFLANTRNIPPTLGELGSPNNPIIYIYI